MLGRRSTLGGPGSACTRTAHPPPPARGPRRRLRRLVPPRARALAPSPFFADVRAPNLTEKASRFPARIFQPASWRLGVPRVEWLIDFDLFVATNFLAPATTVTRIGSCRSFTTWRSGTTRRRRRTSTRDGADASPLRSRGAGGHRAVGVGRRSDLREAYAVDGDAVHVVHHGVDAGGFAPVPAGVRSTPCAAGYGSRGPTCCSSAGSSRGRTSTCWSEAFASSDARHLCAGDRRRSGALVPAGGRAIGGDDRVAPSGRAESNRPHRLRERAGEARAAVGRHRARVPVAVRRVRLPGARRVRGRGARF